MSHRYSLARATTGTSSAADLPEQWEYHWANGFSNSLHTFRYELMLDIFYASKRQVVSLKTWEAEGNLTDLKRSMSTSEPASRI
jgi:hypothetical protein